MPQDWDWNREDHIWIKAGLAPLFYCRGVQLLSVSEAKADQMLPGRSMKPVRHRHGFNDEEVPE